MFTKMTFITGALMLAASSTAFCDDSDVFYIINNSNQPATFALYNQENQDIAPHHITQNDPNNTSNYQLNPGEMTAIVNTGNDFMTINSGEPLFLEWLNPKYQPSGAKSPSPVWQYSRYGILPPNATNNNGPVYVFIIRNIQDPESASKYSPDGYTAPQVFTADVMCYKGDSDLSMANPISCYDRNLQDY